MTMVMGVVMMLVTVMVLIMVVVFVMLMLLVAMTVMTVKMPAITEWHFCCCSREKAPGEMASWTPLPSSFYKNSLCS